MITVRPLRFTDDIPAARAFYEALGLRPVIEGEGGRWVDLRGAAGGLALHTAQGSATAMPEGSTSLSFEVSDPEALLRALLDAGYDDATLFDESYGRVLGVDAPDGTRLLLDVVQDDLYGYRATDAAPGGDLTACPVVFTAHDAAWVRLLTVLGARVELDTPEYRQLVFPDGGCVGVHEPRPGDEPGRDVVAVGFLSTVPLAQVCERAAATGRPARVVDVDPPFVAATDPSGAPVEVYER